MPRSRRLKVLAAFPVLGAVLFLVLLDRVVRPGVDAESCGPGDCGPPPVALPEAIRFGAADPRVSILLWIDLESAESRQIYQYVTRAVAASRREVATELRLLHLPPAPCRPRDASLGCIGPRLVECAEAGMAGAGVQVAGALLDLQWRAVADRTVEAAATAVTGLGLDLDAGALLRCAAHSATVEARLRGHADLAAQHGLTTAPGGLVVDTADPRRISGFGEWLTEGSLRAIVGCLVLQRCEDVA